MSKKVIILIIVFVVVIIGFSTYGYFKADNISDDIVVSGPVVEISSPNHDFGEVIYGDVVSHTFVIQNNGDEPLEILKLSTSCGCTKASVAEADKIIQPGDSIDMLVTFDPAVHKDDSDLGELTRIIYIVTNDLKNSETEAVITANVVKK